MTDDTYKTISRNSEGVFKDKGSKFISYAFPVTNEEEIKTILQEIKKTHHSARHHCYAWRIGTGKITYRANDDGEPSSTAGKPILGQLLSFSLTNTLVVVVRYFGGTLLGVSGLINAYKSAAADALYNAEIVEKTIEEEFELTFSYHELNEVMQRINKEKLSPVTTDFGEHCLIRLRIRKTDASRVEKAFMEIYNVKVAKIS